MAQLEKRFEIARLAATDIVASRRVSQFCIGITGNPTQRRNAYAGWCKRHNAELHGFVMLDWNHNQKDIAALEERLFEHFRRNRKYANTENVRYFRNVNKKAEMQSVYIAWWSPDFWNG